MCCQIVSPCLKQKCLLGEHDEVYGSDWETSTVMCYYHSPRCRPISFPPYHWPSLNNGSCWLKGSSVLSAWVMDAPPVLFQPAWALHRGRLLCLGWRPADKDSLHSYSLPLLFRKLTAALQLFTLLNNVVLHLYLCLSWPVILILSLSNGSVNGRWQDFSKKSSLLLDV